MTVDYSKTYLYKLYKLTNSLDKLFDRQLREHASISLSQFTLLLAINQHMHPNQRSIAAFLDITPAAVSRQVEIALGSGLIEISDVDADRRSQTLCISQKGQSAIRKGMEALEQRVFHIFDQSNASTHLMQHIDMLFTAIEKIQYYTPIKGDEMKSIPKAEDLFKRNGGDINKAVIDVQKAAGHPIDQSWWQKNVGQANNDVETARKFDKAYGVYIADK